MKENEENIYIMSRIDRIHTDSPTYGYHITTRMLSNSRYAVSRKRIRRLMRNMDIHEICPGPNLSKLRHAKYCVPSLLRGLEIAEPEQIWGMDINYLPMKKGFTYMFVCLYSRCVVDYELSLSLEKSFLMNCLRRALSRKMPSFINGYQGCHFTSQTYLDIDVYSYQPRHVIGCEFSSIKYAENSLKTAA